MKRSKGGHRSGLLEAEDYLLMCMTGKMHVVKEHSSNGSYIFCISKSGRFSKKISPKYAYMFELFLNEHGNRDGLFDGCDQTAVVE